MAVHKSGSSDIKGKCWAAFSRYIRVRDCLNDTGIPFVGHCITHKNKNRFHIRFLEAGHCFAGRTNSKLLLAKFVHSQCGFCNRTNNGERKIYEAKMRKRYGDGFVDRAMCRMNKVIKDYNIDWAGRTERYKRKTNNLLRKHGYKTWREMIEETRS